MKKPQLSSDVCHRINSMETEDDLIAFTRSKRKRIQEEDNPLMSHPSTSKIQASNKNNLLSTQNQYEKLEIETIPERIDNDDQEKEPETENNMKKGKKPPPIHLYGRFNDPKRVDKDMAGFVTKNFTYKYIGKNDTLYYVDNADDYKKMVEYLEKGKVPFHTYSLPENKTHGFVLKGLSNKTEIEDIKTDLERQGIKIRNIYKMKGTPEYAPAFLVITNPDVTLNMLQKRIKVIEFTIIRWERHQNNKIITQCHRCQRWGHATSNCYADPMCLKCGEGHLTSDCKKAKELPPKCANCSGQHLSNSINCEVYLATLKKIKNRKEDKKTMYVPAPPPSQNYWELRKQNQKANETFTQRTRVQETENIHHMDQQASMGSLNELTDELNKLNSFINLNKMINLIRQLNDKLSKCQDNASKFLVFNSFISELNSLNLN